MKTSAYGELISMHFDNDTSTEYEDFVEKIVAQPLIDTSGIEPIPFTESLFGAGVIHKPVVETTESFEDDLMLFFL